MPVQVSYPGVYLQEIPSGVHTITGVATSITAFVGRTQRGPVDQPIGITNFGDFQRFFGNLHPDSAISYSVRDFFMNGGSQAVVVRLVNSDGDGNPTAKRAAISLPAPNSDDVALTASLGVARDATLAALKAAAALPALLDGKSDDDKTKIETEQAQTVVTAAQTAAGRYTGSAAAQTAANETAKGATKQLTAGSGNGQAGGGATATHQAVTVATGVVGGIDEAVQSAHNPMGDPAMKVDTTALAAVETVLVAALTSAGLDSSKPADVATAATAAAAAVTDANAKKVATAVATAWQTQVPAGTTTPPSKDIVLTAAFDAIPPLFRNDLTGAAPVDSQTMFTASSPGTWGNTLGVKIDKDGIAAIAKETGIPADALFNLTVWLGDPKKPVETERYINLSIRKSDGARYVGGVLEHQSNLVTYTGPDNLQAIGEGTSTVAASAFGTDSTPLTPNDYTAHELTKGGIFALNKFDLFNLLCIPPDVRDGDTDKTVYQAAAEYCQHRRAMLVVDPPMEWADSNYKKGTLPDIDPGTYYSLTDEQARNAAVYFPRVRQPDPARGGQMDIFPPSGAIAGVIARTDVQRGVWKAPAGLNAAIGGIDSLQVKLTDAENGVLNPKGVNCLRSFPVLGNLVWGARTLRGADQLADDYKYLPVRRLVLYIEESLYRGTQWAVFEPNDEPLWSQLRLNIGSFMSELFRQGAFQGSSPKDAYFVRCDSTTTTQNDINQGKVNVVVGFAPLKPAEFVIISIQQIAGQIPT